MLMFLFVNLYTFFRNKYFLQQILYNIRGKRGIKMLISIIIIKLIINLIL